MTSVSAPVPNRHAAVSDSSGTRPFDVITMGRVGIDLYPLQHGVGLEHVSTFGRFLGGTATNVAIATAHLGMRSAVITRTGDDPFGRFVRAELRRLGVDEGYVRSVAGMKTPVAFCEVFPPDHFPIYFYRDPIAPDLLIAGEELDQDAIAESSVFWATATGLSREPSRNAHHVAWFARRRRPLTVLDLDYRAGFWSSRAEAAAEISAALESVSVAVGNLEECAVAVGESDPHRAADALLERGIELAIVKQGPRGVLAKTRSETVEVSAVPVKVVNGLGAGDGFGGALCHGFLQGWPLLDVIKFANVAGALVASKLECSTAMPTIDEIEEAMKEATGTDA